MKKIGFLTYFLAFLITPCFAQEIKQSDLHEFQIIIESSNDGFELTSNKGCSWTNLAFTLKPNVVRYVNENGMTSSQKVADSKKADELLFAISKTDNGVLLKGLQGTSWTMLEFSASGQVINQNGMTSLE